MEYLRLFSEYDVCIVVVLIQHYRHETGYPYECILQCLPMPRIQSGQTPEHRHYHYLICPESLPYHKMPDLPLSRNLNSCCSSIYIILIAQYIIGFIDKRSIVYRQYR